MAFQLPDDSHVQITIEPLDDATPPNPAQMPAGATFAWSSSDPTMATVVADPSDASGATGLATAVGRLGTVQAQCAVTVPGDPNSPYQMVGGEMEVIGGKFATFQASFGTPAHN